MGSRSDGVVFEDTELASALESADWSKANSIICAYDAKFEVWGFKRPGALKYIDDLLPLLKNPYLLVLFRDPLATSLREKIAVNVDVLKKMGDVLAAHARMVELVRRVTCPILLLSAEKIRLYKEELVRSLVSFLALNSSEEQVQSAVAFVEGEPRRYLNEARADRTIGCVDLLHPHRVQGWVRLVLSESPCKVFLRCDGIVRKTSVANGHREDLVKKGIHSSGNCGFTIALERHEEIPTDAYIEIGTEEDSASYLFAGKLADWQREFAITSFGPVKPGR
jgi:hypothetical protein